MVLSRSIPLCFLLSLAFSPARGGAPLALLHTILPPPTGVQANTQLGYSVAVGEKYAVVGSPSDDALAGDSGAAKIFDVSTGELLFVLTNPEPEFYDYFGQSVATFGNLVVVGAGPETYGSGDKTLSGSAYLYDLASASPTVPIAVFESPNPANFDTFGKAVAISGTRLVIAAPAEKIGDANAGNVYVYELASATPTTPIAILRNPSPDSGDRFGDSVAISGDRVAIGAPYDDSGAIDSGRAYVYDLTSNTPAQAIFTLSDEAPKSDAGFGWRVAISGLRIVVGERGSGASVFDLSSATPTVPVALLNSPSPSNVAMFGKLVAIGSARFSGDVPGEVVVFDLDNASATEPALTIVSPDPDPNRQALDQFGWSVAIQGNRIVVGAPQDTSSGPGRAYGYDLSSASPAIPMVTFVAPSPVGEDRFGISVGISGSVVVVGALKESTGGEFAGSAYVYDLKSATPTTPIVTLNNPSPDEEDWFGGAVAISGRWVVIGACQDDTTAEDAGRAYVYDLTSATPNVPVLILDDPEPTVGDLFGLAVCVSEPWIVVGAPGDKVGQFTVGTTYVYDLRSPNATTPAMKLHGPKADRAGSFGVAAAISGSRLAVGAPGEDNGVVNGGSVYLFNLKGARPTQPTAILRNPQPGTQDSFGTAVAIAGSRVAVGSQYDDSGPADAGSTYVFELRGGASIARTTKLRNPHPVRGGSFGFSVAVVGPRVISAAYLDGISPDAAGLAYLYNVARINPGAPLQTLRKPVPARGDSFAYSVAASREFIVAGAPLDSSAARAKGAVYVFGPADDARETTPASDLTEDSSQ